MVERISMIVAEHRRGSFIITAVAMILIAVDVQMVAPGDAHVGVFTWIAVAGMIYAGIAVVMIVRLPRLGDLNRLIGVPWMIGISPVIFGCTAAMAGSPVLLLWIGTVVSLSLVAFIALLPSRRNDE